MTPNGPKSLKVNEHSNLLVPGEFQGPLFDMDVERFRRESNGKEVLVIVRNGIVDSIEPANHDAPPHHPGGPGTHSGPPPQ
jgi:hypothetical protein